MYLDLVLDIPFDVLGHISRIVLIGGFMSSDHGLVCLHIHRESVEG